MNSNGKFSKEWDQLQERLSNETYEPSTRLQPFVSIAKANPSLQNLYPYTSLYFLRFGTSPFDDLGYSVVALPEGGLCHALRAVQHNHSLLEDDYDLIELPFKHYEFLPIMEQTYFQFDDEGKIIDITDLDAGIEWIFDQLSEWYQICEDKNGGSAPSFFEIVHVTESVNYLIKRLAL